MNIDYYDYVYDYNTMSLLNQLPKDIVTYLADIIRYDAQNCTPIYRDGKLYQIKCGNVHLFPLTGKKVLTNVKKLAPNNTCLLQSNSYMIFCHFIDDQYHLCNYINETFTVILTKTQMMQYIKLSFPLNKISLSL